MQGNIYDVQPPCQGSWCLPILYKLSQLGKHLQWQVCFDLAKQSLVRTFGHVEGKLQSPELPVVLNNSGKSLQAQAWLQAKREYIDKTREGYSLTGSTPKETPAQLCDKWTASMGNMDVACMVKLDGLRAIMGQDEKHRTDFCSRETLKFKFLQHLEDEGDMLRAYLPPGYRPDGELWAKNMRHEMLSGLIRTQLEKPAGIEDVLYIMFDLNPPKDCKDNVLERYAILHRAYFAYLAFREENQMGPTKLILLRYYIARTTQEVEWLHDRCVEAGYEGVVMRHLSGPHTDYRGGRNKCWLKYKKMQDEEGLVIGVEACKGTQAGVAKLKVKDIRGNVLTIKCKGDLHQQAKTWLQNPSLIVGKLLTYQFQELTNKGKPRFPVGVRERLDISRAEWFKQLAVKK